MTFSIRFCIVVGNTGRRIDQLIDHIVLVFENLLDPLFGVQSIKVALMNIVSTVIFYVVHTLTQSLIIKLLIPHALSFKRGLHGYFAQSLYNLFVFVVYRVISYYFFGAQLGTCEERLLKLNVRFGARHLNIKLCHWIFLERHASLLGGLVSFY